MPVAGHCAAQGPKPMMPAHSSGAEFGITAVSVRAADVRKPLEP